MLKLTYSDVISNFPEAWNALPNPYQNDTVLEFFVDINQNLCCEDYFLGMEYVWVESSGHWLEL